jgi:hypothetical protein
MSNKYIERFDKNIKTFKNQDKRFDNVLFLIGRFYIEAYPCPVAECLIGLFKMLALQDRQNAAV